MSKVNILWMYDDLLDLYGDWGNLLAAVSYTHLTYICYAPADDPQIAVAVVIENGYHGYWGAAVAKAIFDEYFFGKTNDQLPTCLLYTSRCV